ncbi:MAG TPA: CHAT domain-containing protein [Vicinamibacterales bacterium]|nr:CHAT domain-containing protein [Vicinamibacterales bacterium]
MSDPAWSLYVRGIELALQRGDANLAFEYSERRRIRTSFDRRSWGKQVLTLAEVQSRLDANSAVTVLNQLTHEVQIWVISRDAVKAFSAPLTPSRSAALVAAHLHEMSRLNVLPTSSAQLFDTLLRPAARVLRDIENIVVVADAPYHRVAFAGLWDRSRNRFVVEDHTLASAPNASASAWASTRRAVQQGSFRQAVVFESPNQQPDKAMRTTGLDRQRKLATLYPAVQLRRGEAATPQNLFDDAAAADVVHVAAPIVTNDEFPGLSRLMLADHPGRKYSGAVVARHLAQAPTASGATLVALETSAGDASAPPVEGARGFASALLSAGVSNVVGPVAEVNASDLDQTWLDFHRYYAGGAAAADSLRRAQLTALRESNHRPGPWALVTVFGSTQ